MFQRDDDECTAAPGVMGHKACHLWLEHRCSCGAAPEMEQAPKTLTLRELRELPVGSVVERVSRHEYSNSARLLRSLLRQETVLANDGRGFQTTRGSYPRSNATAAEFVLVYRGE